MYIETRTMLDTHSLAFRQTAALLSEWEELKNLKAMPEDERKIWLEENRGVDLATTFDLTFARLQELANKVRAERDAEDA